MSATRCNQEVYENGEAICHFHASAAVTEPWVRKVAAESGQRVDWHYMAGRATVRYLGDRERVRSAVERLKPELEASAKDCPKGLGLSAFTMC